MNAAGAGGPLRGRGGLRGGGGGLGGGGLRLDPTAANVVV